MNLDLIVKNLPALLAAIFTAILFIQSGLDKVFDWKGNLSFITGHFEKTLLAPTVPIMFATITVMEVATGVLSAIGALYFLVNGSTTLIFFAGVLGALSITALFFGQRVAKDYPGAAVLVPYFLLMLAQVLLSNPYRSV
jgi:uncharacterized membrane protein YphA (DoxX/SURF4 family)